MTTLQRFGLVAILFSIWAIQSDGPNTARLFILAMGTVVFLAPPWDRPK